MNCSCQSWWRCTRNQNIGVETTWFRMQVHKWLDSLDEQKCKTLRLGFKSERSETMHFAKIVVGHTQRMRGKTPSSNWKKKGVQTNLRFGQNDRVSKDFSATHLLTHFNSKWTWIWEKLVCCLRKQNFPAASTFHLFSGKLIAPGRDLASETQLIPRKSDVVSRTMQKCPSFLSGTDPILQRQPVISYQNHTTGTRHFQKSIGITVCLCAFWKSSWRFLRYTWKRGK